MKSQLSHVCYTEKSISLFENKTDFLKSVAKFKKYGQCEHKLIKYILYEIDENEMGKQQANLNDSLELLSQLGLIYKSEQSGEFVDEKCRSYFHAIFPHACSATYELIMKNNHSSSWYACLFDDEDTTSNHFELYFIRLDQIRRYGEEKKALSALRKEQMLWASREIPADNEFYNYFDYNLANVKVIDEDLELRRVEHDIYEHDGATLRFLNEAELLGEYAKFGAIVEVRSAPFGLSACFFSRFSIRMQEFVLERFDFRDVLVARDLNGTCIRARFNNCGDSGDLGRRLVVEIKALNLEDLNEMKTRLIEVINGLLDYYPGLLITKRVDNIFVS